MSDLVELGIYELVMRHPPMPVETLLGQLASDHARRTYKKVLAHYLAWIERDPFLADRTLLQNYQSELLEYHPPARAALWLRIVGHLYQQACADGLLAANPAAGLAPPSFSPLVIDEVPTPEQAQARLAACQREREVGRRDYALCLLVLDTGLPGEAIRALRVASLRGRQEEHYLELPAEGEGAPAHLAISTETARAINDYLSRLDVTDDSPLFQPPCPRPLPPPIRLRWPTRNGPHSLN